MEDKVLRGAAYACSYVPVEIIVASGLSPLRLIPKGRCSEADGAIHPNTCCFVRSLLADLIEGNHPDAGIMVFANSCDAMRKLSDIVPDFARLSPAVCMDIPKKKDRASVKFFASELRRLAREIERKVPGTSVTKTGLNRAIRECNRVRLAVKEVFAMQAGTPFTIRGSDVMPLVLQREYLGSAGIAEGIKRSSRALSKSLGPVEGPGILLTGSQVVSPEIVEMIEGAGARLTGFDTCFGLRHYETLVREENREPFEAIAERYLMRPPCARMEGVREQAEYLKDLAARTGADGVVISAVKYCDQLFYQLPLLKEGVEDTGLPVLILENDYEWSGAGRVRIMIEAFVEMIRERGL